MAEAGLFAYQDLDPPENAIRLVTLLPGQVSDDVYISITHENLQDENHTSYECLSYTWGSEQNKEKVYILQKPTANCSDVDSLQFMYVGTNLLTALRYIRRPNAPRVIWADAICINQLDISEKGREVARMGHIYNKAAQVLVWLGPDDESTLMAVDTIRRLSAGIVLTWDHRNCNTVSGSEAEVVERQIQRSKFTLQHWTSLNEMIQRPWFKRLWIRQEVQMASKVSVRCGYAEMEWENIEKTMLFVESKVSRQYLNIKDVLYCRSLFPYNGSDNLTYVLHRSSLCGYRDPRDLVYANLSTCSEIKALQINPDYTTSVADVFKDMTCKYIQRFNNLNLFRLCDLQKLPQGFKSFVPNFAEPKSDSRLFSVNAHAGSRQSFVHTEGGNIEVKGRIVAKVQKVSVRKKPLAMQTLSNDNFMDLIKTYQQWEPENLMTSTRYPMGGTLLDAFIMLLSNGFCKEIYRYPNLPTTQESKVSFLAAVWSHGDAKMIGNPKFKSYVDELCSDRRSETFFQTIEGYIGVSPSDVLDGDIVSVLLGASIPIVLRPVVDDLYAYRVVGPCFLQGVMFGQGLLGQLPEDWSCIMHESRRWCFQKQGDQKRTWEDPRLWPLPSHWQAHFCDFNDVPCNGTCELEYDELGKLVDRWFFNTQSKAKSHDDPRLDVQGLEEGGIALQSFILG